MKSNSVSLLRKKLRIMATKTFEELKQLAIQIRDEKTKKQNTATRVGTAMLEHINKLEQDYYDKTKTDEELKERDDKLTELDNTIGKKSDSIYSINRALQDIDFNDNDEFTICDKNGNVIFKVDKNGIKSINLAKNLEEIIQKQSDELVVTDSEGFIIAKINKDGVDSPNIRKLNPNQTWLTGKNIFVLGDSLSSAGIWMKKLAELTGAIFNQDINSGNSEINKGKPISWGGTSSYGYAFDNNNEGTQRAKTLVEISKEISLDVLFIQNVNDGNGLGSCYTEGEYKYEVQHDRVFYEAPNFPEECVFNRQSFITREAALSDFKSNILERIGGTKRSHGMMYKYKYDSKSSILKITGKATSDGTMNVVVEGKTYGCAITTGMSISEICDKIVEWDYPNYIDKKTDDGSVVFIDTVTNEPEVSFDDNGTGVTASITESNNSGEGFILYDGYDYADREFGNPGNWKEWYAMGTMYSKYKGLIEYLQKNLPDTKMYFVLSPDMATNFESLPEDKVYPDGSMDISKLDIKNQRALREIQIDCAKLYGIPVLNVAEEWGLSYFNAYPTYYGNNNVHPTDEGYNRWGETIARLLCGK